jgi:hypothetical protein
MANDIDASVTEDWNGGAGFEPIANFYGSFDGAGYKIYNLYIYRPSTDYVGLFGTIKSNSVIRNLNIEGGNTGVFYITGYRYVGVLAGYVESNVQIENCHVSEGVKSTGNYAGGLVGYNEGTISYCYATGKVDSSGNLIGGLVGWNKGSINNSYATGVVTTTGSMVGGLVGKNESTITECYATGNVNGYNNIGGLVGYNYGGTVTDSYAQGDVTGHYYVGTVIGYSNCVSGAATKCYGAGTISANYYYGEVIGYIYRCSQACSQSYYDASKSSTFQGYTCGIGRSTNLMLQQSTYEGWDFNSTWFPPSVDPPAYPRLRNMP